MDESNIIDFGVFEDFSITFNTSNITNISPLNHRECIASTNKEIIRFERKIIKTRFPYIFSACLIVPETEYIIGVTSKYGTFTVFMFSDISEPILKDYQTNHHGIFHMFYSSKSNSVITVGSGIHVFTFHYQQPDKRVSIVNPKVSFSQRSSFASNYDTTILVPPPFDPEMELIYLPTSNGICPFTLDGNQLDPYTRIPATIKTVYTFNNQSKELLTYDSTDGMSLWGPSDNLICHFSTAGSSIISLLFVDQENVICLNSYNSLFFLNLKTSRTFHCITLHQRPTRIFLIHLQSQPILFVCFANMMKAMKLVIPWKVWNINVKNCLEMQRCNKFCEPARVLVATNNSFIKLYTPKDGEKVTAATPSLAVNPTSFLYDRGLFERYTFNKEKFEFTLKIEKTLPGSNRDVLFIILDNGTIVGFNASVSPCEEVMKIKCKAAFMTICRYEDQWCYAVASENSDLYILDYQKLKETHHFTVVDDKLLKMFYHIESNSIVMVFKKKTLLFDLSKGQIIDTLSIEGNHITSLFSNMLKYGYQSGHIAQVDIVDSRLVMKDNSKNLQRPHTEAVTCFSFSLNFWASLGDDGKVICWNYHMEKVCQLSFPVPLCAGLIMNGRRDLLVATDSELMIVKGEIVFGKKEVDREVAEIDNFDRLSDKLSRDVVFPLPSHEDEEDIETMLRRRDEESYSEEGDEDEKLMNEIEAEWSKSKAKSGGFTGENEFEEGQKKAVVAAPVENSEEDKMKKLEAMQALNGIHQLPAQVQEQLQKEKEKLKSGDSNRKVRKQKKISKHDEKSLANFINDSMENEKKAEKPKKKRRSESQSEKDVQQDKENKSEMSDEKIRMKKDEKVANEEKVKDNDDDDNEKLVLRMKKERPRRTRNENKEDEKSQEEKDDNDDDAVADDETNQETSHESSENAKLMKKSKEQKVEKKETKLNDKKQEKVNEKKKDERKPSAEKAEKSKTNEKEKSKKKLVSIGTQPDGEKQASEDQHKDKNKEKAEKKEKLEKKEKTQIEKTKTKQVEKVDTKKEEVKKKPTKKAKKETEAKSDSPKSKETKHKTVQPQPQPPAVPNDQPRSSRQHKSNKNLQHKSNQKIAQNEKAENKPSAGNNDKKPDPLEGKRPRCPTPPIVRWKKPSFSKRPLKRASTPPLQNKQPIMFSIPPPNIVLDKEAILEFYGRGKKELKPLVDLINQENERIRMYLSYYKFHVTHYGNLNRFDSISHNPKPSNRFFYRQVNLHLPPTRPSYYGLYFFNDEDDKEEDEEAKKTEIRKSDVSKNENLPKFYEMKYAPPLNLIEQGKKRPTIKLPLTSAPSSSRKQAQKRKTSSIARVSICSDDFGESEKNSKSEKQKITPKSKVAPSTVRDSHHEEDFVSEKPNWSLFYSNFESNDYYSNDRFGNGGVDMLESAVMSKMPELELPVSSGYKRTKSVRMYSASSASRRILPSPVYLPSERRKRIGNVAVNGVGSCSTNEQKKYM